MTSTLQRVLVLGAAYGGGFSRRMVHLLGDDRPLAVRTPALTSAGAQALEAARIKRERRQAKLRALQPSVLSPEELDELLCWEDHTRYFAQSYWEEQTILSRVRGLVRPKVYRDILAYLVDSERNYSYAITREHGGRLQEEAEYKFGYLYLNQYTNGGYTGDEYAGEVWIPLNAGYFFNFHYSS